MHYEEKVYLTGNTVRLSGSFKDIDLKPIDPFVVTLIIYNYRFEKMLEVTLGADNKNDVGEYFYDYTTPNQEMRIYYEFKGEVAGKPAVQREGFVTKFVI